jgi:hypothetical protein
MVLFGHPVGAGAAELSVLFGPRLVNNEVITIWA